MASRSEQKFKTVLLCVGLGCLVLPVCAALGSAAPCIMSSATGVADPAGISAASRRDACLNAATVNLTYDASGVRCVQGSGGCDFSTF